jgi:hypothetical protein
MGILWKFTSQKNMKKFPGMFGERTQNEYLLIGKL